MKKNTEMKRNKFGHFLLAIVTGLGILIAALGLTGVILYKTGEASLNGVVEAASPSLDGKEEMLNKIKGQITQVSSVPWQENWIVFDDYAYEYKEDVINLLFLGIDHDGELAKETDLTDWSAGQADAIFLVSLDRQNKRVNIVAIPRNSMVEVDVYNAEQECMNTIYNQICLQYGYAGGGELGLEKMRECVSELLYGVPIHGVCALGYDAMAVMIDMIGGLEVAYPEEIEWQTLKQQLGTETLMLTSENVMTYLRFRDVTQLGSPTRRMNRQKDFLKKAIAKGVEEFGKNPVIISDMYQAVLRYMNTDITMDRAVYLAAEIINSTIDEQSFYQLAGTDQKVDFVTESGEEDFYDDYYLDEDALRETIKDLFYQKVNLDAQKES